MERFLEKLGGILDGFLAWSGKWCGRGNAPVGKRKKRKTTTKGDQRIVELEFIEILLIHIPVVV